MIQEKKGKNRKNIDLVMMAFFVACMLYFAIQSLYSGFIPRTYILISLCVGLVLTILAFLSLKLHSNFVYYVRRFLLGILSILLIIGGGFQWFVQSKMDQVDTSGKNYSLVYVLALKDSTIQDEKDLFEKTIGYVDMQNSLTAKSVIECAEYSLVWETFENQEEELLALDQKDIDVVLMSAQDYSNAKEAHESFASDYKIVHEIRISNESNTSTSTVDITKEPFTVLITGLDVMGEPTQNGLSDVNMLAMVDPINHHVELISINRDTYVPNKAFNNYPDKLTHLGWGGPEASADAIGRIFDIPIDYTAKVTFESLIDIIDCLGGIEVDVKLSFSEQNENRQFGSSMIHIEKGLQTLNGQQALAYARHRKTAGWEVEGREFAQRQVIQAIVDKVLSPAGMVKVGDLMDVVSKYVSTNMPMANVRGFVRSAIESGKGWTFGSSKVDSKLEFLMPVAAAGGSEAYAVLLDEMDILAVHSKYKSMFETIEMNEFEFDLNNLLGNTTINMDPDVVTAQNYDQIMPTRFPGYYRPGIWNY